MPLAYFSFFIITEQHTNLIRHFFLIFFKIEKAVYFCPIFTVSIVSLGLRDVNIDGIVSNCLESKNICKYTLHPF